MTPIKTGALENTIFVRFYLCRVPLLRGRIFDKRSALSVTQCQWVP